MAQAIFWLSVILISAGYVTYPVLLYVWSRIRHRAVKKAEYSPSVSIVIAAHNGAEFVARKLQSLFALDYPSNLLEIILVSDGSTDATVSIAQGFADPRLRVLVKPERQGKPNAVNLAVENATGEIVVFNDVRQPLDPHAVRALVNNFADPEVGAVSGQMVLANQELQPTLGLYYGYEQWMRARESEIYSMIGAAGALYAIRRSLFKPLPPDVILDDMYTPLQIVHQGYRTVFEPTAQALDPHDKRSEFRRKLRTLTGNYQILVLMPWLLTPRNPILLQYVCHKILRLLVPFFLLVLLASSAWLHSGIYAVALALQISFYAVALSFRPLQRLPGLGKLSANGFSFVMANFAALLSFFFFVRGKKNLWV